MKISNEQLSQVLKTYNQKKASKSNSEAKKSKNKGDKLFISSDAKEMQEAKKALESQPEVRREKVERLKKQIKTGNYNVSGEEVADKMLSRTIVDNLV
ncbi:flagellar biosynthesis anti-sigma factor FlgM [Acetohalobium arabaticum]|uniref:Negative regulator of flagellin synthesis n=1 Tax=Acetohalobium arabaticum (strain ATCC 49924 / DSM 5501 / Z-7288) TaxID=574087 RepID=D9QTN1_ACEAZ|nr:flagellar biosynthesis anti-sigma factor FlgM [Acetohalobium arabaticum]ADL11795.1 anti-sigma-28 factor, FlgM [Acetohalobium arabaticum DSM 5501]